MKQLSLIPIAISIVVSLSEAAHSASESPFGYCEPPDQSGAYSSALTADEFFAEDVTFATDDVVLGIKWWGIAPTMQPVFDGVDFSWVPCTPHTGSFLVRVYADDGSGLPGNLLIEVPSTTKISSSLTGNSIAYTSGGAIPISFPERAYQLVLPTPLEVEAGKRYWFSIVDNSTAWGGCHWRWAFRSGGNGSAYGSWNVAEDDFALCLLTCPEMAGTAPILTLRVSAKRVLSGDSLAPSPWGGASPPQLSPIPKWIQYANDALANAESPVRLVLDEVVDVLDPGGPGSLFNVPMDQIVPIESAAKSDPCAYRWRGDAVNIYFVNQLIDPLCSDGFCGAFASNPTSPGTTDIVLISPAVPDSRRAVAHEIGHYLGLLHPWSEVGEPLETVQACVPISANCSTAGDQVCDTPGLPPGTGSATLESMYGCNSCYGCKSIEFETLRYNLMSYYAISAPDVQLSRGQVCRMMDTLLVHRSQSLTTSPSTPLCPWEDLGGALAGASGLPVATGQGPFSAGSAFSVDLGGAAPSAPGVLVFGTAAGSLPLFGGVLIPSGSLGFQTVSTDVEGTCSVAGSLASTFPAGVDVYLQYWLIDSAGPAGFSASNALGVVSH